MGHVSIAYICIKEYISQDSFIRHIWNSCIDKIRISNYFSHVHVSNLCFYVVATYLANLFLLVLYCNVCWYIANYIILLLQYYDDLM